MASGVLSLRADRATEVVASRHRLGGPYASAGPSRRAASFRSARDHLASNYRARALTPFYTSPGASWFSDSLASALATAASVEQRPAEGAERRKSSTITETAARGSAAPCQKDHMAHFCSATGCRRARKTPSRYRDLSRKEPQPAAACSSTAFSIPHSTGLSPRTCLESIMKPSFCFKQVLVGAGVAAAAASQKSGEFRPRGSHSSLLRAC